MSKKNGKLNEYKLIITDASGVQLDQISDSDLDRPKHLTDEEKKRDKQITQLLNHYVENYKRKTEFNSAYKKVIVWFCIGALGLFLIGIIAFAGYLLATKAINMESIVGLVTSTLSFVGLFIGVLKIITEYVFPKDEEQYITKIVEDIQQNDLRNKEIDMDYMKDKEP